MPAPSPLPSLALALLKRILRENQVLQNSLDELPFEVAAATARLLKHHARSGAWVELSPGNPSQASRAGRDRDRSSPNCPSDMSELSENSD